MQHDFDWRPVVMTMQHALQKSPSEFQSLLNDGTPIVLIGQPEAITFNISTLFGLLDFRSTVWCTGELLPTCFVSFSHLFLDSDQSSFTQDATSFEMRASIAAHEICDWRESRPLIISYPPQVGGLYQVVERWYVCVYSLSLNYIPHTRLQTAKHA